MVANVYTVHDMDCHVRSTSDMVASVYTTHDMELEF
jgi:hypothetical protein